MPICTDIVDSFYDDLEEENYKQYIGQSIDMAIKKLNKTHTIVPYRIDDLKNRDGVVWESIGDRRAHICIYNDKRFYFQGPNGTKIKPVMITYRRATIKPIYIIRRN